MSRQNPKVRSTSGWKHRKHHKDGYYTAVIEIQASPAVKRGLIEIAEREGRSISWVLGEVINYYFGLEDDTPAVWFKNETNVVKFRKAK